MIICRRLVLVEDMYKRLLYYLIFVLFGSLVTDCAPGLRVLLPFQTAKDGILNQWFVKIGWFWTLALVGPFIYMLSEVTQSTPSKKSAKESHSQTSIVSIVKTTWHIIINRHLMRLWINTVFWYSSVNTFLWLENKTSRCSSDSIDDEEVCKLNGYKWYGFDISGHTFILLFSLLIIVEECKYMRQWEGLRGFYLRKEDNNLKTNNDPGRAQKAYLKFKSYIVTFFLALTVLSLIWHFMLLQTILFYHTTVQKVIAYFWAVSVWALGYKFLYKSSLLSIFITSPVDQLKTE